MAGKSKVNGITIPQCPVSVVQDPDELARLLSRLRELKPKRILEIGSLYGGTLWTWMEAFAGATVVSVDMIADNQLHPREKVLECRKYWEAWATEMCCLLHYYVVPSESLLALEKVSEHAPFDFIFVDGGHKFKNVSNDFLYYYPMLRDGGLMAFHDVGVMDGDKSIDVGTWWRSLKATGQYRTEDIIKHPGRWGIGVLWKPE